MIFSPWYVCDIARVYLFDRQKGPLEQGALALVRYQAVVWAASDMFVSSTTFSSFDLAAASLVAAFSALASSFSLRRAAFSASICA